MGPGISALSPPSRRGRSAPGQLRPVLPQPFRGCLCSPGQKIPWVPGSSVIHTAPSDVPPLQQILLALPKFRILSNFNNFTQRSGKRVLKLFPKGSKVRFLYETPGQSHSRATCLGQARFHLGKLPMPPFSASCPCPSGLPSPPPVPSGEGVTPLDVQEIPSHPTWQICFL